ncbi:MAG: hypothetical protein KGJ62_08765 [Armatimonadetes bacterium]|nr:hypothetical protein [Armatimonadota bacterium]MDE2205015.1 hypothetical protein [Armatimonadota bacterium]
MKSTICALAVVAVIALATMSVSSTAQTRLSVINLGPTGPAATATAVNDDYQVTGTWLDSSYASHGFFWQPGLTAQNLTNALELNGINNLGILAGQLSSSGSKAQFWYPTSPYSGVFTAGTPFASPSNLTGVGDDLVFCGWEGATQTPFWSATNATFTIVDYSYGSSPGTALAIMPAFDAMVGYSGSGNASAAAWWPYGNGTTEALSVVTGFGSPSAVTAVDAGFDMVGYATSTTFPNPVRPMAFSVNSTSTNMGLLPHTYTGEALAINGPTGMIGGYCGTEATVWYPSGGNYAYFNPTDLNTLTGPTSQWHLQSVTGINDYGAFVGAGLFGQKHVAYLAIPVTLSGLTLSSNQVVGTTSVTGTVTIGSPAPFDMTVSLSSFLANATFTNGSHSSSVVIAQGTTDADFQLNVANPSVRSEAYIRANYGGWDVYSKLVSLP